MLSDTIQTLRKEKGYSQEEVAIRLNVVRQTVSKWEKGLSVPDADMLMKIAELFEVPVSVLLGGKRDSGAETSSIAEQLTRINEQLAIKNRRARRIWTIIGISILVFIVFNAFIILINLMPMPAA
ncbi:MAG: helix-turn-helix transcriptional regulator [Clostridiaceae bacterium]